MENGSSDSFVTAAFMAVENNTEQGTESVLLDELPFGIEAFAPFLLLELIIVVTCNLVLMALVIKARKVNNNTNIYLFSLSICGLLQGINLFTLMVVVFARHWVFGRGMCYVNDFLLRLTFFPVLLTHALVSRDRYKAIKDPLNYWKVSTKKTYILNITVWTISTILALGSVIWYVVRTPIPDGPLYGLECFYGLDLIQGGFTVSLIEILAILVCTVLWIVSLSIFTLWHYIHVLKELHTLAKLRSQFRVLSNSSILKVNGRDKPLHCTAEERAAKSLALMFLFQFICSLSLLAISILNVTILTSNANMRSHLLPLIVPLLSIYILPSINPVILALSNKRFRKRVKGLLKCELKPELEESNDYGHLDEADSMRFPSVNVSGINKRTRSIFMHKSKSSTRQHKPETSNNNQKTESCRENEVAAAAHRSRNASVSTVDANHVQIEVRSDKDAHIKDDGPSTDILEAWREITDQ